MKPTPRKRFCLPLACLLALSACAPGTAGSAEPAPIEVPPPVEQINEGLTIFYTDYIGLEAKLLDAAVTQFNQLHPDNPVTAEKIFVDGSSENQDNAYTKMLTEVMAGEGPDLFFLEQGIMDIEKMVRRGVFADMEPYFEADNFDWSGYNQAVMDAGVWDGQRLVIPLEYQLPILYTSQGALDETGFSAENCATFDGFLTEVETMLADPDQTRQVFLSRLAMNYAPFYGGLDYADYDRQTVDLSLPELARVADIYKNLGDLPMITFSYEMIEGAGEIMQGNALLANPMFCQEGFLDTAGCINKFDDAVMLPIRDTQGGIRAQINYAVMVRNSSPNLQNAYEFIKFLLSEEFQLDTMDWRWQDFSVLNATNERYYIANTVERYNSNISPDNPYGFTGDIVLPQSDYDELLSYMNEVSGAFYYSKELNFIRAIPDYLSGEAPYDEAVEAAERQMNLYLSE